MFGADGTVSPFPQWVGGGTVVGMDAVQDGDLDEVAMARIRASVAADRRRSRRAWWWGGLAGFATVLVWQLSTQLVGLKNVGQFAGALAWSVLLACLLAPVAGIPYARVVRALGAPLDRWEDRRRHAH
ncbi:hypothetical protein ACFVTZ_13600 [Cellulosimicrobium cellulans]|uniref:hypothetical protein n=1 Tax=Cellulosimicrobium cellulans TaxID=1710 RepID=UPI0036E34BD1